jgi:hypothetical protein
MSCRGFALKMWPDHEFMHIARSNGGNGAQRGKKAWLCAGSYLAKLTKRGLARRGWRRGDTGYCITREGKQALEQHEKSNTKLVKEASN